MYSRHSKTAKNSANSSDQSTANQFAPRRFVVESQQQTPDSHSHSPDIQLSLENTSYNQPLILAEFKSEVENYAQALSNAVETARDMIATKYFIHVPSIDGYMQNFVDNFNSKTNKFINNAAMPRQAGYWIESYATKIATPSTGGKLNVILQAKRGNSRPDVVLQSQGQDIAWLDITSSGSGGHIFQKNSAGWYGTPYVTEVTYKALKINELNTVSIPDKSTRNISGLLDKAQEAYQKQLLWEAQIIEKYGLNFGDLMHKAHYYVKESAIQHEDAMDLSDDEMDEFYDPEIPGNKYEKLALSFISDRATIDPEARELAAVVMYWQGMVNSYEKRFGSSLPAIYHPPKKQDLGLSWVKDVSSADGEPFIRDWFPV